MFVLLGTFLPNQPRQYGQDKCHPLISIASGHFFSLAKFRQKEKFKITNSFISQIEYSQKILVSLGKRFKFLFLFFRTMFFIFGKFS
jgi:hypothetical protein